MLQCSLQRQEGHTHQRRGSQHGHLPALRAVEAGATPSDCLDWDRFRAPEDSCIPILATHSWPSTLGRRLKLGEFPGGLIVRIPCFHCRDPGSILSLGTKIPQTV